MKHILSIIHILELYIISKIVGVNSYIQPPTVLVCVCGGCYNPQAPLIYASGRESSGRGHGPPSKFEKNSAF